MTDARQRAEQLFTEMAKMIAGLTDPEVCIQHVEAHDRETARGVWDDVNELIEELLHRGDPYRVLGELRRHCRARAGQGGGG